MGHTCLGGHFGPHLAAFSLLKNESSTQAVNKDSVQTVDIIKHKKTQQLMGRPQRRVTGAGKRQRSECIDDDDKDSPLNRKWTCQIIGPLKTRLTVVPARLTISTNNKIY